jgi:uncharacterized iron-regulated membrane protein
MQGSVGGPPAGPAVVWFAGAVAVGGFSALGYLVSAWFFLAALAAIVASAYWVKSARRAAGLDPLGERAPMPPDPMLPPRDPSTTPRAVRWLRRPLGYQVLTLFIAGLAAANSVNDDKVWTVVVSAAVVVLITFSAGQARKQEFRRLTGTDTR